jgi:tRNA (guanine37-N1)-methyltransferase
MFRPPVNRAMRVLDRSFFKTTVPLASAAVMEARNIGPVQARLMKSKDLLNVPSLWRVKPVAPVQVVRKEDEEVDRRRKCLLLRPEIKPDGTDILLYCVWNFNSRLSGYTCYEC